jgi:hypothetical protein
MEAKDIIALVCDPQKLTPTEMDALIRMAKELTREPDEISA